jgi:hypothetical protein
MAKIRNVKIIANLKGMDKEFIPLYEQVLADMVKVLESSHLLESWKSVTGKYKTRMEGELNAKIKKMTNEQLELLIFDKTEIDKNGAIWHIISDIDVRTYYTIKNVIGYGLTTDDITRVNTRYLKPYSTPLTLAWKRERAQNLYHEKFHDRGAHHDSAATARRPNSAAYLAGTVMDVAWNIVFKEKLADVGVIMPTTKPVVKPIEDNTPAKPDTAPHTEDTVPTPVDETVKPVEITNPNPITRVCYKPWWGFGLITRCYNINE